MFSQIDLSNDLAVIIENSNSYYSSYSSEYLNSNFTKVIKEQNSFNRLMKDFEADPEFFIESFFNLLVSNGLEMSISPISHILLIKSIPLLSSIETELLYCKVFKRYFNIISCNKYGIEGLNALINNITLVQSILIDFMNLIKVNIFTIVSNCNSIKILDTLLLINNYYISNIIIDAILSNTLYIALSPNGSNVINTLIKRYNFGHSIIQILLKNIGVILIHNNGYLIVELLYSLNNSQIVLYVSTSILSNISYLADKGYYLKLIEKWIPYFDPAIKAKLSIMIYDQSVFPHLRKDKKKFKGKTVECASKQVNCLRGEIRKKTR